MMQEQHPGQLIGNEQIIRKFSALEKAEKSGSGKKNSRFRKQRSENRLGRNEEQMTGLKKVFSWVPNN